LSRDVFMAPVWYRVAWTRTWTETLGIAHRGQTSGGDLPIHQMP
jgi:hypothetical protein